MRSITELELRHADKLKKPCLTFVVSDDVHWPLKFCDAITGEGETSLVSVAHEKLFDAWPVLADWIAQNQDYLRLLRQVRLAAREWDANGRSAAFLWQDERLQPVYVMLERLQPELDDMTRDFIRPEASRLLEELTDIHVSHPRRSTIGERLNQLKDPRPGVGLRLHGLPDIVWCEVPAGEVNIKGKVFRVDRFFIAKYLITYEQFEVFMNDEIGYRHAAWWEKLAVRNPKPGAQRFRFPNFPRENVSWYDAIAFCRWLTEKMPDDGWPRTTSHSKGEGELLEKWIIRLPIEWEWQQAASGGNSDNK